MSSTPLQILSRVFGYERFHPLQERVIDHVMRGFDALVLMPTGGGKSLCYQVPALCSEGLTLVISPLVSLMKDQVEMLRANGVSAAYWNSTQNAEESREVWDLLIRGALKLLYVSPEKLFGGGNQDWLSRSKISLVAIDEAHCISFWGHDFRPEYTKLGQIRTILPGVTILALTATADPIIRRDILSQLAISSEQVFQSSFDRPNLHLAVLPGQKRVERILEFLGPRSGQAGIIYCTSRAGTEGLAEKLTQRGYSAHAYHAGLPHATRSRVQEKFLRDEIQIVCATVAFGMGIDKSNVRWVIHYNLPKNLEGFYQEIGRAGRDGLASETLLFYSYADVAQNLKMMNDTTADRRILLEAKLERMKQYAEANQCRRRVLLSYFGETLEKDCGHCDVCNNPPVTFDGTEVAQKLLSAVYRTGERATLRQVALILRGSHALEITEPGWHELKTFGVGRDLGFELWMEYGTQIINGGWLTVAYDKGMVLQLTPRSMPLLKGESEVHLVQYLSPKEKKALSIESSASKVLSPFEGDPQLLELLKAVRTKLAQEHEVPPYIIFSDKTLKDMAAKVPLTSAQFRLVHGVGEVKLESYGSLFLRAIGEWKSGGILHV